MIVYQNTKSDFINDVMNGIIADKIEEEFEKHHIPHSQRGEYRAWANSLHFMKDVLDDDEIGDDCELAVEYQIPLTAKRVDFLISGSDENGKNNVVIVELKQWEDSKETSRPDVVYTFTGGSNRFVTHPSYQAYSYAKIIENFNESIAKYDISLYPCAYLHNYNEKNRSHIDNNFYNEAIKIAPIFLQRDAMKLRAFIKRFIKKRGGIDILMKIENGKLKPTKSLQDAIYSMLEGNQEFFLIDEQKVAFEIIKSKVKESLKIASKPENENGKFTIVIKGGPGTGKSVVAIQLLVDLIKNKYAACYVTKNSAPRNVYFEKLSGKKYTQKYIKSLFLSSGAFVASPLNQFDCLICDEAHRLNAKSGMFKNMGENQIKEIIHSSKVSVFFIDEDQRVTASDIGTVDEIIKWAKLENSTLIMDDALNLVSQFRCSGSDGYLAFLDNLLDLRETANYEFDFDYDLRLFASPSKMREELRKLNNNNKAGMIAGYCYNWITQKNPNSDEYDINLEDDFHAKWNFNNTSTWAIDEDSFEEVGCIHTSQGLEFDYVGVIIGKDLRFENDKLICDYTQRAKTDKSLHGVRKFQNWQEVAKQIIKNTYKVLLSRGQKGCFIYCEDKELLKHISEMTKKDIIY